MLRVLIDFLSPASSFRLHACVTSCDDVTDSARCPRRPNGHRFDVIRPSNWQRLRCLKNIDVRRAGAAQENSSGQTHSSAVSSTYRQETIRCSSDKCIDSWHFGRLFLRRISQFSFCSMTGCRQPRLMHAAAVPTSLGCEN